MVRQVRGLLVRLRDQEGREVMAYGGTLGTRLGELVVEVTEAQTVTWQDLLNDLSGYADYGAAAVPDLARALVELWLADLPRDSSDWGRVDSIRRLLADFAPDPE
jgi:hypothetical protein